MSSRARRCRAWPSGDGRKVAVDMDGYATFQTEVDELIKIAVRLAERRALSCWPLEGAAGRGLPGSGFA